MTPKNLEVNNYFPTDIVPPDQQHLHILQMALNLNPIPITGNTNAEILLQVQNLVQLEKFCGFFFSKFRKFENTGDVENAGESVDY